MMDDIFDASWKAFVKQMREENERCNERLYRLLEAIRGKRFVIDLQKLLKDIGEYGALIRVVRSPVGICINDKRWKSFKTLWINQRSNGHNTITGTVCIQVKDNRWLLINYQT